MNDSSKKLKTISFVALFASLTAVGAQIAIPIGNVPITLQMFFVFLSGLMLEPFEALLSMLLYILLGGIGLPVFANFSGGISYLVGPTAGYLWAFPLSSFLLSWLRHKIGVILSGILSLGTVYFFGWFVLGIHLNSFQKAFFVGVLPFILIDIVKLFAAYLVAQRLVKFLGGNEYGKA
jgi:biotin transport system substrate-specific component